MKMQIKEKDSEYRINEMKIRELRRQVPARVLKPLDQKTKLQAMKGGKPITSEELMSSLQQQ